MKTSRVYVSQEPNIGAQRIITAIRSDATLHEVGGYAILEMLELGHTAVCDPSTLELVGVGRREYVEIFMPQSRSGSDTNIMFRKYSRADRRRIARAAKKQIIKLRKENPSDDTRE